MLISVVVLALTGLFGIWYSHKSADDALRNLGDLTKLIDASRRAQVEFKIQVQNWKNLLLRGQNAEEFAVYWKRFEEQDRGVQETLTAVMDSPELPAELRPELESIAADHKKLLGLYQAAVAQYSSTNPATIFAVDQSVRGIDQKLNDRIDAVAVQMVALEDKRLAEMRAQSDELYANLRMVALIVSSITVICAVALARRSLRGSR